MSASSRLRGSAYFFGAGICLVAALVILGRSALPERADFGQMLTRDGRSIAPEIGAVAPSFVLNGLDGEPVMVPASDDRVTVVNFWATWCEPCRLELPVLEQFYRANHQRGLRVVAVNVGEPAGIARQWVEALGLTFEVALDPEEQVAALYQLRGQPTTFVINSEAVIARVFFGPVASSALDAALALELAG